MSQITAKEAIRLIGDQIDQGARDRLSQIVAEIGQAAQSVIPAAGAGLDNIPDISKVLATAQTDTAKLSGLREQAKTGVDNLASVLANLGLADEIIFAVEEEPQPQKLIIDPHQKVIIRGEVVGKIPENSVGLQAVEILGGVDKPLSQSEVAVKIKFTPKGKSARTGVETYVLRSSIAEVNRAMENQGLPRLIVNLREGGKGSGYVLGDYQILGIKNPAAAEVPVTAQLGKVKPETFNISQVLRMEGISGVLSETQTRRLTQELLAKGNFRVGAEVMEGRAQARGASSMVVRDLELTPAGVEIMRDIANQFGAQSRISTDEVVDWLEGQKQQPVAAASSQVDAGKRYLISQVAAQTGIPDTAIKVLHEIGALKEGIHFEQRGRVKVYKDEAFPVARQVAHQAKKEDQGRFTERLIRKAVGLPKEKNGENPYGPNGPSVLTSEHERIILDRLKRCESGIEQRLKRPLGEKFKTERDQRLGELTARLADDESLRIGPEAQYRNRREAAATVLELANDARKFNFIRQQHPGLELALMVIKALDAKSVGELAQAMVNPPKNVPDTIDRNGLVNGIRTVDPMGDE